MHTITLTEPVLMSPSLGELPAGEWLVTDLNAFEIAQKAKRGTAKVNQWRDVDYDFDANDPRPTLIIRQGAWGDLLLLTPAIDEWKMKHHAELSICCFEKHFPLFKNASKTLGVVSYPFKLSDSLKYREIISLENTMECDHDNHATDVFAKALRLETPILDYRPRYFVTDEEKEATKKHLFSNRPNIVIQQRASVANRDYPLNQWLEVIVKLEQRGWGVLLIGHKGQIPDLPPTFQSPFIRNLSKLDLSFRESAAVLSQAQAFCGVDSAFAHLCHALDIPAVVLFAAFRWHTRTSKAPKTIALSGVGPCAPCSWHMHAGRMFPPDKPCTAIQRCVVLADIPPERIVSKLDLLKP